MLKRTFFMSTLFIALLALAACGKSNDNQVDNSVNNEQTQSEEENNMENEDSTSKNEADGNTSESDDKENNETEDAENKNQPSKSLADAKLVHSDQQSYSINVLPNFTLTSEEPGRDSLFLNEDGRLFMRIETLSGDNGDIDYLIENTIASLDASGDGNPPLEITNANLLPKGENIKNAVGYTVETAEGKASGLIFKRDNMFVRLTIYDNTDGDFYADFLAMGETITNQ